MHERENTFQCPTLLATSFPKTISSTLGSVGDVQRRKRTIEAEKDGKNQLEKEAALASRC